MKRLFRQPPDQEEARQTDAGIVDPELLRQPQDTSRERETVEKEQQKPGEQGCNEDGKEKEVQIVDVGQCSPPGGPPSDPPEGPGGKESSAPMPGVPLTVKVNNFFRTGQGQDCQGDEIQDGEGPADI
jgi:hypothetical protein